MILTNSPKLESKTERVFELFDYHDTYDFVIEGCPGDVPTVSALSFQNTLCRRTPAFGGIDVSQVAVIVVPFGTWLKSRGFATEYTSAVREMLSLLFFDGQLESGYYYVLVEEESLDTLPRMKDKLSKLLAHDIDVFLGAGTKTFAHPEIFSPEENLKIKSLPIGRVTGMQRRGSPHRRAGLKTFGDVDNIPKIFLERENELVAMYLSGLSAPLLKDSNFGVLRGTIEHENTLAILDRLTFGHEDLTALEQREKFPQNQSSRAYCIELFELFQYGMPYAKHAEMKSRIEDIVKIWKTTFNEVGICLNLGVTPNELTMVDVLRTTSAMTGIKSRIDAYYAGVPLAEITADNYPIGTAISPLAKM